MKTFLRSLTLVGTLIMVATNLFAADVPGPAVLQSGDVVGICGDSITEQKIYSLDVADYLVMCQPQPKLSAVQFGWGGESAYQFVPRMQNDVLPFHPTVVTICYGMNDGRYAAITPSILEGFTKNMTEIVRTFKANGVRQIVVGTPGAVDPYSFSRMANLEHAKGAEIYNATLATLGNAAKEIARQENVAFADVHGVMMDAMTKAKEKNGEKFLVTGVDGVHPQADGHLLMAYAFLKGLGCDGNIGTISVDLRTNQAQAAPGTRVVSYTNGKLELESTKYPYCFPAKDASDPNSARSILPFVPFNRDLNRYMLMVKNASSKSLKITWGTESKVFSSADLARGINLADEFLDNPFSEPFAAVQNKVYAQETFETQASKELLHSLLALQTSAETRDLMKDVTPQLTSRIIAKWDSLRNASAAAVTPVKHALSIEAIP